MPLETRFRLRFDDAEPSEPLSVIEVLGLLRRKLSRHRPGERYRFRVTGRDFGPIRTRLEVMAKASWHTPRLGVGEFVTVTVEEHRYRIRAVLVKVPPAGPPLEEPSFTDGYDLDLVHPDVATILRTQAGFDIGVRCNGLAYTRPVGWSAGQSWWSPGQPLPAGKVWSAHSKRKAWSCQGGAADTYFPAPAPTDVDMARGDRLVRYMVGLAQEGALPASTRLLIWRDRFYDRGYDFEARPYSGVYHHHLHSEIDVPPEVCNP